MGRRPPSHKPCHAAVDPKERAVGVARQRTSQESDGYGDFARLQTGDPIDRPGVRERRYLRVQAAKSPEHRRVYLDIFLRRPEVLTAPLFLTREEISFQQ